MFSASELFEVAAQIEANGEQFYRLALKKVNRDSLKNLLGWLADQELLHKSAFSGLKEQIALGAKPDTSYLSLNQAVLSSVMGRHAFSLDELQIDSIQDEEEMLRAALLFEEDTIVFFEFISPFVSDPDVTAILEKIKAEELNHKQLLMTKLSEITSIDAK